MGTPHVEDDLCALLMGELDRDRTRATAAHLRQCPQCTHELIDMTVAHAAFTSAMVCDPRPVTERTGSMPTLSLATDVDVDDDADVDAELQESTASVSHLQLAPPAPTPDPPTRPTRMLVPQICTVAAGAVALVAGIWGIVATAQHAPGDSTTALLQATGPTDRATWASVTMTQGAGGSADDELQVTPTGLGRPPGGHYYEAWLVQPSANKMVAVGMLAAQGTNQYLVPAALMHTYSAMDVTLQADDGDPSHSSTSVLHGSL